MKNGLHAHGSVDYRNEAFSFLAQNIHVISTTIVVYTPKSGCVHDKMRGYSITHICSLRKNLFMIKKLNGMFKNYD
jgi:hypothetical protein